MNKKTLQKIKYWLGFSLVIVIVFTVFLKLIEPAFAQTPPFQPQQTQTQQNPLPPYVANPNAPPLAPVFDPLNPVNTLPPSTQVNTETTYTPLAPLPGLEGAYDTTGDCPLGKYLNIMIKLIIGIATVLAMVMIVLGGMEYMTSELISSKEAGKEKIKNAIIGLLIALGAWLILNTINPTLLNVCLSDIPKANLEVVLEDDRETYEDAAAQGSGAAPSGPRPGCPEGIVSVSTSGGTFHACATIAPNLRAMINAAWASNPQIKISGGGFRTAAQQIERRIANCGGNTQYNIYQKPSRQCNPPTARPGTSRHEVGKAFDFRCNGQGMPTRNNVCFQWLKTNASTYKLYNYPVEPWHWSVDGN